MKKRGQLTIFIIVGVLMVSAIGLFFVFRETGIIQTGGGGDVSTSSFLRTCIEDRAREGVRELSLHGGYHDNQLSKEFKFDGEESARNISYLCYVVSAYVPCKNQKPTLLNDFENNMHEYLENNMDECFNELRNNYEDEGYDVNMEYTGFDVNLEPREISIETDSKITLARSEETKTEENFRIGIPSKIYGIINTVSEIVDQQVTFCNFNAQNFMLSYPEYRIKEINIGTEGMIYSVENRDTNEKFRFAVRSCIIPSLY